MSDAATTIVPLAWGPHECARDGNPHRQLMAAVLQTAVDDYWGSFRPRSTGHDSVAVGRRCRRARSYMLSKDRVWPFSFENLCDALDLDAGTLRRVLLWGAPVAGGMHPTGPVTIERILEWWRRRESSRSEVHCGSVQVEAGERAIEDEGASLPPACRFSPRALGPDSNRGTTVKYEDTIEIRGVTVTGETDVALLCRMSNQERWIAPTQLQLGSTVASLGDAGIVVLKRPFAVEQGLVPFQGAHDPRCSDGRAHRTESPGAPARGAAAIPCRGGAPRGSEQ